MLQDERAAVIEGAKTRFLDAFRRACAEHDLCAEEARSLLQGLRAGVMAEILPALASWPSPSEAPERWSDRVGRKENPPAFIRRVYRDYLQGGFTRATLRRLDPELYGALVVWEHRHPHDLLHDASKRRRHHAALAPELK